MKKVITLSVVLLALVATTIWWMRAPRDTFANDIETQFAYEHISQIQRIFISDWGTNQAELIRQPDGSSWLYVNKATGRTFPARPDAMRSLLESIEKIRVRMKVADAAAPNVIKSMTGTSRKIQLFDAQGNILRSYSVGGPAERGEGTFMLMDGATRPCVTYIPGWVGSVHTRFIVTEALWRDKALFRLNPNDVEQVQVEYQDPLQMQHSFRINKKGEKNYDVLPVSSVTNVIGNDKQNKDNVLTYMDDFNSVVAEVIVYDKKIRDSVIVQKTFATVQYKTKSDTALHQFKLYPMFNPGANRGDGRPGVRQQIERYYVDAGNEDNFYVVQHPVIQKILWGYSYFFQAEKVTLQK